jgi:ribosomal protein S12 methylthiotransferase
MSGWLGIMHPMNAEGAANYRAADLVIVNTRGFIGAAAEESLETTGEALAERA